MGRKVKRLKGYIIFMFLDEENRKDQRRRKKDAINMIIDQSLSNLL